MHTRNIVNMPQMDPERKFAHASTNMDMRLQATIHSPVSEDEAIIASRVGKFAPLPLHPAPCAPVHTQECMNARA